METGVIKKNLQNIILEDRKGPQLAKIIKVNETSGQNKFTVDVILVKPDYTETKTPYQNIPVKLVWPGLIPTLDVGLYVVVEYLDFNESHPFVSGVWSKQQTIPEHKKNTIQIIQGQTSINIDNTGKIEIKNSTESLKTILESIFDTITTIRTVGSPAAHTIDPTYMSTIEIAKLNIGGLLK